MSDNSQQVRLDYTVKMCPINRIPADDRWTPLPVGRKNLWKYYLAHVNAFWTPEEIKMHNDRKDFMHKLSPSMQRVVKYIIAFFAAADKIVNVNLDRFRKEVDIPEAQIFYNFQAAMEDIHAITYAMLRDEIIPDISERERLQNAFITMPVVRKMIDWMFSIIKSDESFAVRLLRMACVEGIFFHGCFAFIGWLADCGLMQGLTQSNELIMLDEGLHTEFALELYNSLPSTKLPTMLEGHAIVDSAVLIATEFMNEAVLDDIPRMNAVLMGQYIKNQADVILNKIYLGSSYKCGNPFPFMDRINLNSRINNFERQNTSYSRAQLTVGLDTNDEEADNF